MIKIYFKEDPGKEVSANLQSIKRIGNNSQYDPLIKENGGEEDEYIDQELRIEFHEDNESNIQALIINGNTLNIIKKLIKKSL